MCWKAPTHAGLQRNHAKGIGVLGSFVGTPRTLNTRRLQHV